MENARELVRQYVERAISDGQGYLITYYRQGDDSAVRFMAGYITKAMHSDRVAPPANAVIDELICEVFEQRPRASIDDCDCESGKLGPHVGFLHVCDEKDGPGAEGSQVERCEVCQTLPDDEAAKRLHATLCGCGWGTPCPECGEGLRICWAGGEDMHCDACGAVVPLDRITKRS
jgi:hypothetical protein